jgi:hypothetical protein
MERLRHVGSLAFRLRRRDHSTSREHQNAYWRRVASFVSDPPCHAYIARACPAYGINVSAHPRRKVKSNLACRVR